MRKEDFNYDSSKAPGGQMLSSAAEYMLRSSGGKIGDGVRMIDQPSLLRNHKITKGAPTPQHQVMPMIQAGNNSAQFEQRNMSSSVTQRIPLHHVKAASQVDKVRAADLGVPVFDDEATIEDDVHLDVGLANAVDLAPVRKVSRISSSVYNFNRKNEVPDSRNLSSQLRTTHQKNENVLCGTDSLEKMGN